MSNNWKISVWREIDDYLSDEPSNGKESSERKCNEALNEEISGHKMVSGESHNVDVDSSSQRNMEHNVALLCSGSHIDEDHQVGQREHQMKDITPQRFTNVMLQHGCKEDETSHCGDDFLRKYGEHNKKENISKYKIKVKPPGRLMLSNEDCIRWKIKGMTEMRNVNGSCSETRQTTLSNTGVSFYKSHIDDCLTMTGQKVDQNLLQEKVTGSIAPNEIEYSGKLSVNHGCRKYYENPSFRTSLPWQVQGDSQENRQRSSKERFIDDANKCNNSLLYNKGKVGERHRDYYLSSNLIKIRSGKEVTRENIHEDQHNSLKMENSSVYDEKCNENIGSYCDSISQNTPDSLCYNYNRCLGKFSSTLKGKPGKDVCDSFVNDDKVSALKDDAYEYLGGALYNENIEEYKSQCFPQNRQINLKTDITEKKVSGDSQKSKEKQSYIANNSGYEVHEPLKYCMEDCVPPAYKDEMSLNDQKVVKSRHSGNYFPCAVTNISFGAQQKQQRQNNLLLYQKEVSEGKNVPMIKYDISKNQRDIFHGNAFLPGFHSSAETTLEVSNAFPNPEDCVKMNKYRKSETEIKEAKNKIKNYHICSIDSLHGTGVKVKPMLQNVHDSQENCQSDECSKDIECIGNLRHYCNVNNKADDEYHRKVYKVHHDCSAAAISSECENDSKHLLDALLYEDEEDETVQDIIKSQGDLQTACLYKFITRNSHREIKKCALRRSMNSEGLKMQGSEVPENDNAECHLQEIKSCLSKSFEKQEILTDYGMQISNSLTSSHLTKQLFLSMYNEWVSNREFIISHLQRILDNIQISEGWYRTFIQKWTAETQSLVNMLEIPVRTQKKGKFSKLLKGLWNKLFNRTKPLHTFQTSHVCVQEFKMKLEEDVILTEEMLMYGLQCITQFRETHKLIKEFWKNIFRDQLSDDIQNENFQKFFMAIMALDPEDDSFCIQLSSVYNDLNNYAFEAVMPAKVYKAFCEFVKEDASVLQTLRSVNWNPSESLDVFSENSAICSPKVIKYVFVNLSSWSKSAAIQNISQTLKVLIREENVFARDVAFLL